MTSRTSATGARFVFADLVLAVRDVHAGFTCSRKTPACTDEVGEDERAPVADVREVKTVGPRQIHADFFVGGVERGELLTERDSVLNSF